jgi:UMF1 family MFS transporter
LAIADALNPGVRQREVLGWASYDFANSGYTTVVLTAVFNAYFVGVVAGGASWATFAWTLTIALSSLIVAAVSPALGAWADRHAARKRVLLLATLGCVVSTAMLSTAGPGTLAIAVVLVVASNVFYCIGESIIASFLPDLARPESIGRVSGWGWGLGYFGGMLTLGLSLAWLLSAPSRGATAAESVSHTLLITALVFGLASLPTFVLLRERRMPAETGFDKSGVSPPASPSAWAQLSTSLTSLEQFPDLRRLLICMTLYQAGISVVIALAAVYAEQQMGFSQTDTMILVFTVNIASALGAFGFGAFQDRMGHRRALAVTLIGWVAMTLVAGLGTSKAQFWSAAVLAGLCIGASQSCGRAMVGLLAPDRRLAEFFGLWSLAIRIAAVIGPLTYGAVTWATAGNHRLAILSTGLFFVAALAVLRTVDIDRGTAARSVR